MTSLDHGSWCAFCAGMVDSFSSAVKSAAQFAYSARHNADFLPLMAKAKPLGQANPKCQDEEDLKTLVDILIQELLAQVWSSRYPQLTGRIYGEENADFAGHQIIIGAELSSTLQKVLQTNPSMAHFLNDLVDRCLSSFKLKSGDQPPQKNVECTCKNPSKTPLDLKQCAIWIDPIDATNVYVRASQSGELYCVCVLAGLFDTRTGLPVFGVVAQPFPSVVVDWAFADHSGQSIHTISSRESSSDWLRIIMSQSDPLFRQLTTALIGCKHLTPPAVRVNAERGCGYKLLCVARGSEDIFVLSSATSFLWDSCAPHALLLSTGGGIVHYQQVRERADWLLDASRSELERVECLAACQLRYKARQSDVFRLMSYCNEQGIVAYRSVELLLRFLEALKIYL